MFIDYIKLKNYRQYKDVVIDNMYVEPGKNVIVIEGTTGAGKTNFLNAITWCLYGEEFYLSKKYEGLPLLNTLSLSQVGENEIADIEVEIGLTNIDKSKKYKIKRSAKVKKLDENKIEIIKDRYFSNQSDGSKLEILVQIGKDMGYFRDPTNAIQRIFPKEIHEYFFFDGERLDDYFREEAGEEIKKAVFRIAQLDLLKKVISHLEEVKKKFFALSKDLTPKIKDLEEKKACFEASKKKLEEDLEKLKAHRKEAEADRKEIQKELIGISPKDIKRLAEERESIEKDLKRIDNEFAEEEKNKAAYLISVAPTIFLCDAIDESLKPISKRKEAGEIPPDYKRNFLEKLLKEGVCICGMDISKDNDYRLRIKKLLEECDEITNITEEIIELHNELRRHQEKMIGFDKNLKKYTEKIKEMEEDLNRKRDRLKNIEDEIKGVNIEKIKMLEERYEDYNNEIKKADEKIGELCAQIRQTETTIEAIKIDLDEELKKEKKLSELRKINSFCEYALNAAQRITEEIMRETREEIERKTKEEFFAIIPKAITYSDVKIDDNYTFSVTDQQGRPALGTLSAGERQSLALAFIAALNTVSGIDAPIIIDTPLARIDREPRENIAKTIPKHFKNTQVILLVTSTEYTSHVRDALSDVVWKDYKINFKEYTSGSEAEVKPYE